LGVGCAELTLTAVSDGDAFWADDGLGTTDPSIKVKSAIRGDICDLFLETPSSSFDFFLALIGALVADQVFVFGRKLVKILAPPCAIQDKTDYSGS
jgi:hypothetical protein